MPTGEDDEGYDEEDLVSESPYAVDSLHAPNARRLGLHLGEVLIIAEYGQCAVAELLLPLFVGRSCHGVCGVWGGGEACLGGPLLRSCDTAEEMPWSADRSFRYEELMRTQTDAGGLLAPRRGAVLSCKKAAATCTRCAVGRLGTCSSGTEPMNPITIR